MQKVVSHRKETRKKKSADAATNILMLTEQLDNCKKINLQLQLRNEMDSVLFSQGRKRKKRVCMYVCIHI